MSFSLSTLLYPYAAFLALFAIGALVNIMHVVKFGTGAVRHAILLIVFLAGTAAILWGTAFLLVDVEWSTPFTVFGSRSATTLGF